MSDYLVRRASPAMVLQPLFVVAILAAWKTVFEVRWPTVVVGGLLAIGAGALRARAIGTRLRVDSRGITLGTEARQASVCVPWASVREVVVVDIGTDIGTDIGAYPRVGVRLQPGAPLPDGVRGIIQDPADPDRVPPVLVRTVPGLDREALVAAVQAHDVRVVSASDM